MTFPLLVKPVADRCDLACKGCFYEGRSEKREDMRMRTFNRLSMLYAEACDDPLYIWQGGEPTLWGLNNFREAKVIQQSVHGHPPGNILQTHGLHLDKDWLTFLRQSRFEVGLSYDGPHGATRPWNAAMERFMVGKARDLTAYGIPWGLMTVVDSSSVHKPEETMAALSKLHAPWVQFIPKMPTEPGVDNGQPDVELYREFLIRARFSGTLYGSMEVVNFDQHAAAWLGQLSVCTVAPTCPHAIIVEANGDLYPCDMLARPEWKLGNVWSIRSFRELVRRGGSPRLDAFRQLKQLQVPDCEECQVRMSCNRGCPADRFYVAGDFKMKNPLCASDMMLAEATRPRNWPDRFEAENANRYEEH